MTRAEWVEAGARAANRWPGSGHPWTLRDEVETVIAAVEPLIRADERERITDYSGPCWDGCVHKGSIEADLRAQIAADIEAHYTPLNGDVGPSDYDEGLHVAALLARGQCGYVDCMACARLARGES